MSLKNLARPIAAFLEAAEKHEIAAILSDFAVDALLTDHGQEYRGAAIHKWGDRLFWSMRPFTRSNIARKARKNVLTVIAGGAGEREPEQFDWTFEIVSEKISALIVERSPLPHLPVPVATYVQATNTFDLEQLISAFADDAIVNDQSYEYRGREEIREWARGDIVGERVTMYVVNAVECNGHTIICGECRR
jgi:hypothetical protein